MSKRGTRRSPRSSREVPEPTGEAMQRLGFGFSETEAKDRRNRTPGSFPGELDVGALQRTAGNAAVVRLLRERAHRVPPVLQAKLMMGAANDPLEREADRVADQVLRSWPAAASAVEGSEPALRRATEHGVDPASSFQADDSVALRLSARRGSGKALPPALLNRMEAGFGADFGEVRIHRDAEAAELSAGLAARAFTHGTDIYFGRGAYDLGSRAGRQLLAHELTHVVQQGGEMISSEVAARRPPGRGRRDDGLVRTFEGERRVQRKKGKKTDATAKGADDKVTQAATSGFPVDFATRQIIAGSPRVPLAKGSAVQLLTVGGQPEEAKDADGKPFGWVLCSYNQQLLTVPPESVLPPQSQHVKRLKKTSAVASFMLESTNEATEGTGTGLRVAAKDRAIEDAKDVGAITTPGAGGTKDDDLSTREEVYKNANLYDAKFEAGVGSVAFVGDWFASVQAAASFINGWKTMSTEKKVEGVFANAGNVVKGFASATNFIAQAQIAGAPEEDRPTSGFGKRTVLVADGKGSLVESSEDYQATEIEKVSIAGGLFASPVDALSALKDAVKGLVTWGKHLDKADEHGNLAREGVGVLQGFGKAAKAALAVAYKVKDFFEGTGATTALEMMPGVGVALNAIEITKRSMDIHRAKKDAVMVKQGKASSKSKLQGFASDLEKLDRHKIRARRLQLEQVRDKSRSDDDRREAEEQLAVIAEYFLDRDLANTADKRRNRAILAIVKEAQSLAGNIATLAGQAHAGLALKLSSTATGLGATAVRKLKQFNRDRGGPRANKNKTTEKKNLRYIEIAEVLYDDFVKVNTGVGSMLSAQEMQAIKTGKDFEKVLQDRFLAARSAGDAAGRSTVTMLYEQHNQLKGRVKAAGVSWREFVAEKNPAQRFSMLVAGQKRRE